MKRTDLQNLEKRRWASKYWRELPAEKELAGLLAHGLTREVERRTGQATLAAGDAEAIAREVTSLRYLLVLREQEQQRLHAAFPLLHHYRQAA